MFRDYFFLQGKSLQNWYCLMIVIPFRSACPLLGVKYSAGGEYLERCNIFFPIGYSTLAKYEGWLQGQVSLLLPIGNDVCDGPVGHWYEVCFV